VTRRCSQTTNSPSAGADAVLAVVRVDLGVRLALFQRELGHVHAGRAARDDVARAAFTARVAGCQYCGDAGRDEAGRRRAVSKEIVPSEVEHPQDGGYARRDADSRLVGLLGIVLRPHTALVLLSRGTLASAPDPPDHLQSARHTFCSSIEFLSWSSSLMLPHPPLPAARYSGAGLPCAGESRTAERDLDLLREMLPAPPRPVE